MDRKEAVQTLSVVLGIPLEPKDEEAYLELKTEYWGLLGCVFEFLGQEEFFKEAVELNVQRMQEVLADPKFLEFVNRQRSEDNGKS